MIWPLLLSDGRQHLPREIVRVMMAISGELTFTNVSKESLIKSTDTELYPHNFSHRKGKIK